MDKIYLPKRQKQRCMDKIGNEFSLFNVVYAKLIDATRYIKEFYIGASSSLGGGLSFGKRLSAYFLFKSLPAAKKLALY